MSQFRRPKSNSILNESKSRDLQGILQFLERFQVRMYPLPLLVSPGCWPSSFVAFIPIFKASIFYCYLSVLHFLCLPLSTNYPSIRLQVMVFRARRHGACNPKTLNSITSTKTFPNKVTFIGTRARLLLWVFFLQDSILLNILQQLQTLGFVNFWL